MDLRQNSKYIKKKYALAIFRGILWTCIDDNTDSSTVRTVCQEYRHDVSMAFICIPINNYM